MKAITIKDAQPANDNICPYCKNPDALRMTPLASKKSYCGNCKKWFDVKLEDWHGEQAENMEELREQLGVFWNKIKHQV